MKDADRNFYLKSILLIWKITFIGDCLFLAYSIYNKIIGAIVFCTAFILFNAFLIKKYSKKV